MKENITKVNEIIIANNVGAISKFSSETETP
jgi:hypothetical protein